MLLVPLQKNQEVLHTKYRVLTYQLKLTSPRAPEHSFRNRKRLFKGLLTKITDQPMHIIHELTYLSLNSFN